MSQKQNIEALSADRLRDLLGTRAEGLRIEAFDELDSTNRYARKLAQEDAAETAIVVAASQSAGRGRMGRSFFSPDGGVYFSILHTSAEPLSSLVSLTGAAAVAVMRAVRTLTEKQLQIKWVNDLLLDNKKVCGILAETVVGGTEDERNRLIIGIGVNWYNATFPQELMEIAGSVGADRTLLREALIAQIYLELQPFLKCPSDRSWLSDYRAHSAVIGREICWMREGERFYGSAVGIDENGALLVKARDGETVSLSTGEISVRVQDSLHRHM